MIRSSQRGDTLVEVLLATIILSVIVVGAVTIMTRGQGMALDSLERTQVTAAMTEQSESIQYIRDAFANAVSDTERTSYPAVLWDGAGAGDLLDRTGSIAPACTASADAFYIQRSVDGSGKTVLSVQNFDASTINESSPNFVSTYAKPGSGLWIEAQEGTNTANIKYVDFHIKACWRSATSGPKQEAITIVRMYAPDPITALAAVNGDSVTGNAEVGGFCNIPANACGTPVDNSTNPLATPNWNQRIYNLSNNPQNSVATCTWRIYDSPMGGPSVILATITNQYCENLADFNYSFPADPAYDAFPRPEQKKRFIVDLTLRLTGGEIKVSQKEFYLPNYVL